MKLWIHLEYRVQDWAFLPPREGKAQDRASGCRIIEGNKEKGSSFPEPLGMNKPSDSMIFILRVSIFCVFSGDKYHLSYRCCKTRFGKRPDFQPYTFLGNLWNTAAQHTRKDSPNETIYWHTLTSASNIERVSNPCFYKTSRHKLWSENQSIAGSYTPK